MRIGSAHQTRRAAFAETGGGGGGRGTLEVAVMSSSLVVASMTLTEVTTRIAIVGVVTMVALLVVGRMRSADGHRGGRFTSRTDSQSQPVHRSGMAQWFSQRSPTVVGRLGSLGVLAAIVGATLGIGLSLLLVAVLNATSSAAN